MLNNWKDFLALDVELQKAVLHECHNVAGLTTAQIGERYGTYANKVRRHASKIGFQFRNRSEAQALALSSGRIEHPTAGRQRTEEEKIKIGQSVSDKWSDISDEERERRSEVAKENWNNRPQDQIDDMHRKATKKRLEVAKDGSKLEHFVVSELLNRGFQVEFHKEQSLLNEKVHLDIWLPKLNTAVEIDGPTHFEPIWGEEHLKKTQKTDNMKDGLLLNAGCCIIRLRQKKNLSKTYGLRLVSDLVEILNKIGNKFPELGERRIVLGDKYD
jgi:hypothetical protein